MRRVIVFDMRMNVDDKELALAAAGGDGQAFGVLLRRHYDLSLIHI